MPASALPLRHARVQRLRRLLGRGSARRHEGAFVAEGAKLLSEALAAGAAIEGVYVSAGAHDPAVDEAFGAGCRVYELAPGVVEKIAGTVTPQPVLTVVGFVDQPLAALAHAGMTVVAVDVRDPGNAGTLMRCAEASGAEGVVYCDGSVDVYNPKTVRASAGSLFHLPVVVGGTEEEVLDELGRARVRRIATVAEGGVDYATLDLRGPVAFVVGNEAHGLDHSTVSGCDIAVTIPMARPGGSLNVGMAAAVLCFEAARQQRLGPPAPSPEDVPIGEPR